MTEDTFRKHARGTVDSMLGALHIPIVPQYYRNEQSLILEAPHDASNAKWIQGVRLKGYLNQHDDGESRGLVVLIHGWQGSSHTPDTIYLGSNLFDAGFDTIRLNLRDHGKSLPLNPGLFHGGLIHEVAACVKQLAKKFNHQAMIIVGTSLGGNFALRLAQEQYRSDFANLEKVVCICPAVNPRRSAELVDKNPIFRRFFCTLWKSSLRQKEKLFPWLYEFSKTDLHRRNSVASITQLLYREHFVFDSLEDYFDSYTLDRSNLDQLMVPTTILASKNDPVVCIEDLDQLAGLRNLVLDFPDSGGHIGFVNPRTLQRRLADIVVGYLEHF